MTSYFLGVLPILPTPLYCPTSGSIEQESEIMALLSIIMTTDPISEQCFKGYSMIGYWTIKTKQGAASVETWFSW